MKLNILTFMTLALFALTFTSCDSDPIRGCMDANAENYNADAEEDDGSCSYARDKFIGSYLGELSCPGVLGAISNPMFAFEISEGITEGVDNVGILLVTLGVTINGTVSGNDISINSLIPGYPFDATGNGMPDFNVDLTVTGSATLDSAGSMMTGQLDIVAVNEMFAVNETDSCALSGTKQ